MAMTRLPVLKEANTAPAIFPFPGALRWRWSPDAKIMAGAAGTYNVCNFSNGRILTLEESQGRLLTSVSGISIPFALPPGVTENVADDLVRHGVLLAADDMADYEAAIRARILRKLQGSHGLIIMPTEKCNYRCTYCYESFEKGRMSPEAADAVALAIERTVASADQFGLSFFGGEPLLCPDLILRFSRTALAACAQRGLPYGANITTNAHYLTPELFEELLENGVVSYQITVDGDRELHDQQRKTIKGGATFDRVVGHLQAMARSGSAFHCRVRCNARPQDQQRVLALFDGELRVLRDDPRFEVAWHTIWSSDRKDQGSLPDDGQGSEGCASSAVRPLDEYLLNRELAARGLRTRDYGSNAAALATGCYAGKPNWFVVGSDLTLYKCTVVFDREDNRVGRVNPDGTFTVDSQKQELWTGSNALTDSSCGTCHLRVPCSGLACPLQRFSTGHKHCFEVKKIDRLRAWSLNRPAGECSS